MSFMRELALFAGAGGGVLGGKLLGWRTVCAVECDPYAASVLVARQNDGILDPFPVWDDVRTFDGRPWRGIVDVVSGGFPCQAYSNAARGRHTARGLWPEMLRIISEVRPRYAFSENPSEDAIIEAQADLAAAGYSTARIKLSASFLGAPHIRDRWWMVADSDNKSELGGQKYAKVEGQQKCRNGLWETDPREPRVVDGVANRMDRLKCIGNGQVPSVAAAAWGYLTGYWGNLADEPATKAI